MTGATQFGRGANITAIALMAPGAAILVGGTLAGLSAAALMAGPFLFGGLLAIVAAQGEAVFGENSGAAEGERRAWRALLVAAGVLLAAAFGAALATIGLEDTVRILPAISLNALGAGGVLGAQVWTGFARIDRKLERDVS